MSSNLQISTSLLSRDEIKQRVLDIGNLPWLKNDSNNRGDLNPYMVSRILWIDGRMILLLERLHVAYCSHSGPGYSEPLNKEFAIKNVKVGGVVSFHYHDSSHIVEYRDAIPEAKTISDGYRWHENPLDHCHTDPNIKICLGHHADILHEKMDGNDELKFEYVDDYFNYSMHDKHDKYYYYDTIHKWYKSTSLRNVYTGKPYAYSGIGENKRCKYCENPPVLRYSTAFLKIFGERYPQYLTKFSGSNIIITRDPTHKDYVKFGVRMIHQDKLELSLDEPSVLDVIKEDGNFSMTLIHNKGKKGKYDHYYLHSTVTVKDKSGKLFGTMKLMAMDREIMPGLSNAKMVVVPSIEWDWTMSYTLTKDQKQLLVQVMIEMVQQETEASMIAYGPYKTNGFLMDTELLVSRALYACKFVVQKKWDRSGAGPRDDHVYCWHNPRKEKDDIVYKDMMMRMDGTIFYQSKQAFATDTEVKKTLGL